MAPKNVRRTFRLAVVDRAGLATELEAIAREKSWPVEVLSCSSALETVGDSGPGPLGGLVVSVGASGPFLTDLPKSLFSEEQRQALAQRTALGRWGEPEELAGPALLLASEAGSYITGSTLLVDGGIIHNTA